MFWASVPVAIAAAGLIVCVRGLHLAQGALDGTIARFEAERATEVGTLLTIIASPWLGLTATLLDLH